MIEKLFIFENSGICLFSKNYTNSKFCDEDELITGFLSVLFGYLDSQYGRLQKLQTSHIVALISKVQNIYITLIVSRITNDPEIFVDMDRITLLNKRLENVCKVQLGLIERKINTLLLQLKMRQENTAYYKTIFSEIGNELDVIILDGQRKIEIITKVFQNTPITQALEIS